MKKVCHAPGCAALTPPPCPEHPKAGGWQNWRNPNADTYRGDWPKIRARVLREEPRCRLCGSRAEQVDHIIPVSRGGTHERVNLRGVCGPCHRKLTARQFGYAARRRV